MHPAKRLAFSLLSGLALLIPCSFTTAAERLEYPVGRMVAYPILNISFGYSTDIYYTETNAEGDLDAPPSEFKGSWRAGLLIGAGVQGKNRGHLYGLEYAADASSFLDGPSEDALIDHRLVGYWGTAFDKKNNLDVGFEYLKSHDARSEEDPINGVRHSNNIANPDKWQQFQAGGIYVYGTDEARGKFELATCFTCRRYDNNDQEFRDVNIADFSATLYARVSPKTHLLLQVIRSNFDYVNTMPGEYTEYLDSDETRYLVGATWKATRKTTGTVKVGYVDKDFDSDTKSDYSNITFDADIDWRPDNNNAVRLGYMFRPYEAIDSDDGLEENDLVEVQQLDLTWSHRLTPRITTQASTYIGQDEYKPSGRSDDRYGIELGLRYKTSKFGTIGLRYFNQNRDSSVVDHDYNDQGFLLEYNIGQLFGFGDEIGAGQRAPDICRIR